MGGVCRVDIPENGLRGERGGRKGVVRTMGTVQNARSPDGEYA